MSFSITRGQELIPVDMSDKAAVHSAIAKLGRVGGALFTNLPPELKDDITQEPKMWAGRVVDELLPIVGRFHEGAIPSNYGIEARRQTHHDRFHMAAHRDPKHRDPIFFGETRAGEAEFRFTHKGKDYYFTAAPDVLWTLAGPSLSNGGSVIHELGAPVGGDRLVSIGAVVSKDRIGK